MSEKLKASKYNQLVEIEGGGCLAFNGVTCGLAKLDKDHRAAFASLCDGSHSADGNAFIDAKFVAELKSGGFVVPQDLSELDVIRFGHYRHRFNESAFGMTIIPTLHCNFSCDYCYQSEETHQTVSDPSGIMTEEVQDGIVKVAEDRVKEKGSLTVTWYGGEPLLCRQVISSLTRRLREICQAKAAKYVSGIITNGYLLDAEGVQFLSENGVVFGQVTLDGPREVHDRRRPLRSGEGTFDRILENLQSIPEDSSFHVSIRVNIDNRNKDTVRDLLLGLKARGFHERKQFAVYFGQVLHYSASCRDMAEHCMISREFADYQLKAYREALDLGFRVGLYPAPMLGNCGAISAKSMIVEPTGSVQNCWNAVGVDRLRTGFLSAGKVEFNSSYYRWLGWSPFHGDCSDCSVLPLCMGGCPFKTLYRSELANSDDNTCIWWKFNLPQMLNLYYDASRRGLLVAPTKAKATDEQTT